MSKNQSIEIITLNDGRLIKNLTLMLDSRLTVFTGAMSSGKTSILEALATTYAEKHIPWEFTNYVTCRPQSVDISDVSDFAIMSSLSLDTSKPFTAYSKGEQAIIGLYWSIANRLKFVNDKDSLLVLIDDLGHDLSPIWQQMILPSLLKDFPTARFVITTTSHIVLSHVPVGNLFFVKIELLDESSVHQIRIYPATEYQGNLYLAYLHINNNGDLGSLTKQLAITKDMIGSDPDRKTVQEELRLRKLSLESEINNNYTLGK